MNRRLVILTSAAALLGIYVLADEGGFPGSFFSRPAGTPPAPAASGGTDAERRTALKLNPLEGLDPQTFSYITERPLFNPGRLPRPPEPPPPPPVVDEPPPPPVAEDPSPKPEDYQLIAVAGGPSGRVAAVRLVSTGEVVYVREGQPLEAWNVLAVNDRSVVIGSPAHSIEVKLFETAAPPPAPGSTSESSAPQLPPQMQQVPGMN